MKTLTLMIMPNYDSARESLGYEDFEEGSSDAILFQQGYDADVIEIEDKETFKIEEGFIGRIIENDDENDDESEEIEDADNDSEIDDSELYLISDLEDLGQRYEYVLDGDLEEGSYKFLAKHNTILMLD